MLTSTYIHIPGVSWKTERALWSQGAWTWYDFLADPRRYRTRTIGAQRLEKALGHSLCKLEKGEHQFFRKSLPPREAWRAFPEFRDRLIYLDIETTGSRFADVTVVGAWDGAQYHAFVKDENLFEFPDFLSRQSVVVTFFGAGFDLPVLRKRFPTAVFDQIHIDLCPVLRRIGLRGGLKSIERAMGIERTERTRGLTGYDAVRLWRASAEGSREAMDTLLEYNREDVRNLEPLMEHAYGVLRRTSLDAAASEGVSR